MIALRGRAVWIIAALGLFLLTPAFAQAADENPCNGSDLLCSRTLDQVVLPGTHNSMSAAENNWALPNQTYSISNQLSMGVRAFLIDTYYGVKQPNGQVLKANADDPGAQTYMCHSLCQLGSVRLTEELGRIKDFVAANPREVLIFVNESGISPADFAEAVDDSGLLNYIYRGPTETYPTIGEMVASGERVVMFSQGNTGDVPWYHNGYAGPMMETPYDFKDDTALLTDPAQLNESCRALRGQDNSPLFLMNHWISTGVTPDILKMEVVNTKEAIVARARACETRRGKLPNIVAVDFFGTGDVIGAVRTLNGIPDPPPDPPPVDPKSILVLTKPKAVTVMSKRIATFRLPVTNSGDASEGKVKVCASVPAKIAHKPRCVTIPSIAPGRTVIAKLKISTKKRYRRAVGSVRFSVHSSLPTLKTAARLTVKPLKKPRKHR